MQLSDRLQEIREKLGLTQEEIANRCGVAKRTYCDYESGKSEPKSSFLIALSEIGGDILYLLTGTRAPVSDLSSKENALLENYRASTPEHQSTLDTVSAALAQPGAWRKSNA
ncbi:helix-turn-helix domain-containing protein [Edwardsiella anguillarum]|uniref:helix-turn-helix domain-containing protein n=1 Tax=Edwardsiella anguillarum TaxID=1821960 RepID=UPI0024B6F047|nr:helix-turn-helix transcriptional regulator [Edwardsiella anguillarum]WHQ13405.1 helix-turn-helix domain-containing protein [Edwardsiella anguillarum]